jgi:hypothetical protein
MGEIKANKKRYHVDGDETQEGEMSSSTGLSN